MKRLLTSSRFQATLLSVIALVAISLGVSEERADALAGSIVAAIVILTGILTGGTAIEDAAEKLKGLKCIVPLMLLTLMGIGCAQNNEPAPEMVQNTTGPQTPQNQWIINAPSIHIQNVGIGPTTRPAGGDTAGEGGVMTASAADGFAEYAAGGVLVFNLPTWQDGSTAGETQGGAQSPRTGAQSASVQAEQSPRTQVVPSMAIALPGGAANATAGGTAGFDGSTATGAPTTGSPNQTPQYLNLRVPSQMAGGLIEWLLGLTSRPSNTQPAP